MTPRRLAVNWLYAATAMHFVVGVVLAFAAGDAVFDGYHRGIESAFWPGGAPAGAREAQVWWIRLFGATIQSLAIWMAALVHAGDVMRRPRIWLALLVGLLVWAPQDIGLSLQRDAWVHVAVDMFALLSMLPVMAWLAWTDRAAPMH